MGISYGLKFIEATSFQQNIHIAMAKTRSQSRRENDDPLTKKSLSKKLKAKIATTNCVVRLNKLTNDDFAKLMNEQDFARMKRIGENKKYNLRKRGNENVAETKPKPQKPLNQIVAMSQAALYTSKAMRMWDILTKQFIKSKEILSIGQLVCARMSGHRPWPSKIETDTFTGFNGFFSLNYVLFPQRKTKFYTYIY